ncbi:hypothetical protein Pth03_74360 [Planotetraspora thailandica]|uniref:Metalloprotease n=1 Tax=Planotetraspora thailandica TaxID=487172 RepID=A0A8J3Y1B2_9ACTN|nr:neutral zinc metallopeptidase [Planotetraspora thailandica]GII59047.1 hypothetical protein Pth03_74360 [Planotetraspora thailandica]
MRRPSRLLLVSCAFLTACSPGMFSGQVERSGQPDRVPLKAARTSPAGSPSPSSAAKELDLVSLPTGLTAGTDSPLYTAPKAKAHCDVPSIKSGSFTSMKKYMTAVSACLDRIWTSEFRAAKIYYSPPERKFIQRRVRDPKCGMMPAKGADGTYCGGTKTYYVLAARTALRPDAAPWASEVVAHEYGHHVQHMINILDYEESAAGVAPKSDADVLSRRVELQAECFAGVAISGMGGEMPSWWDYRSLYTGYALDGAWVRDHGKLSTQMRWLGRGYRSGKPEACDTWSVSKRDVT